MQASQFYIEHGNTNTIKLCSYNVWMLYIYFLLILLLLRDTDTAYSSIICSAMNSSTWVKLISSLNKNALKITGIKAIFYFTIHVLTFYSMSSKH